MTYGWPGGEIVIKLLHVLYTAEVYFAKMFLINELTRPGVDRVKPKEGFESSY